MLGWKSRRFWRGAVTVAGALIVMWAALAPAYRRWRVDEAVEWLVSNGTTQHGKKTSVDLGAFGLWQFEATSGSSTYLNRLSLDAERAERNLRMILLHDQDYSRSNNAQDTLDELYEFLSPEEQSIALDQLINEAVDTDADTYRQRLIANLCDFRLNDYGLSPSVRSRLVAHVRNSWAESAEIWLDVLSEIGGEDETQLLIELMQSPDLRVEVVHELAALSWPGAFDASVKQLNGRGVLAFASRNYSFYLHPRSHQALFDVVISRRFDGLHRRSAAEYLIRTPHGRSVLLAAWRDEAHRADMEFFAPDLLWLMGEEQLIEVAPLDVWPDLVRFSNSPAFRVQLESAYGSRRSQADQARIDRIVRERSVSAAHWLRLLSGRSDLTTGDELVDWVNSNRPEPISIEILFPHLMSAQAEPLDEVIETALLDSAIYLDVSRPELAALRKLLKSPSQQVRSVACQALLGVSGDAFAVPTALELIRLEQEKLAPRETWHRSTKVTRALSSFLGQNFFLDADAWQAWWETHRDEFPVQDL